MTISLDAIYRYPVKGLSPQHLEQAQITKGRPLPWDRAFAIENGPSGFDEEAPAHLPKNHFLMLMSQPELAALRTEFDPATGQFSIHKDGDNLASGNLFEPESMSDALAYLADYCHKPVRAAPRLLHAKDHAFTDSRTQDLTLINLASVEELSAKAGSKLDPIRFRGNLYISGASPWLEHDWIGRVVEIGGIRFQARKRTQRCAATNANPQTGERDQTIPKLLLQTYDHADCGIHLMPLVSGVLHKGDVVKIQ
ncbi:MOSC domain-containing protein [Cohaesibacter celericrescens]|uniref:MOSC domain-containing protein n=1 Tax=Cohaesibacter celericrescens TaxID=2067669 RepID=UPI00356736D3